MTYVAIIECYMCIHSCHYAHAYDMHFDACQPHVFSLVKLDNLIKSCINWPSLKNLLKSWGWCIVYHFASQQRWKKYLLVNRKFLQTKIAWVMFNTFQYFINALRVGSSHDVVMYVLIIEQGPLMQMTGPNFFDVLIAFLRYLWRWFSGVISSDAQLVW